MQNIVIGKKLSDKIFFTSFIKEEELIKLLDESEFVVLPAIYSISASGPMSQAISLRKPIISTNLGTNSSEIQDGIDGLLCKPRDAESLENAISRLIKDEHLRMNLISNVKIKADNRSWNNIAKKTFEIYNIQVK